MGSAACLILSEGLRDESSKVAVAAEAKLGGLYIFRVGVACQRVLEFALLDKDAGLRFHDVTRPKRSID